MDEGVPIYGPDFLAAVALSLQAIVLEIEAQDGPSRQVFADRISALTTGGQQPALDYSISLIARAIGCEPPPPPELRLV
jgi:hypothetical protein